MKLFHFILFRKLTTLPTAIRSMANQKLLAVDAHDRVVATVAYRHHRELNESVVFGVEKNSDGMMSLKSGLNGLFLCLDNDHLIAQCNTSIQHQEPEFLEKICFDHDCRVFGLRSMTNSKLLTVENKDGKNDGLLKVFNHSFYVFIGIYRT